MHLAPFWLICICYYRSCIPFPYSQCIPFPCHHVLGTAFIWSVFGSVYYQSGGITSFELPTVMGTRLCMWRRFVIAYNGSEKNCNPTVHVLTCLIVTCEKLHPQYACVVVLKFLTVTVWINMLSLNMRSSFHISVSDSVNKFAPALTCAVVVTCLTVTAYITVTVTCTLHVQHCWPIWQWMSGENPPGSWF